MGGAEHIGKPDRVTQIGLIAQWQGLGACRPGQDQASENGKEAPGMRDLLCHVDTFARIEAGLKPYAAALAPLTMDDAGTLARPWSGDVPDAPIPDIVYGTQDIYFSPAVADFFRILMAAPAIEWFQSSAAGIEHPVLQAVGAKAGAYTSSHEQSAAIAEWVLWAALDHFQGGPQRRAAQAARQWRRMPFREIGETRWLIVGFGHIGRASAERLRALGAHVTGLRRKQGADPDADAMTGPDGLHAALGDADAVLLSLPLTDETEGLADDAFFAAMRPGALLLNVGRGGLVDEAALLAALDRGRPGHAALDVTATEPLPADNPLWSHPAITLTPHISALTDAAKRRTDALFLDNLERFLAGEELRNHVSKAAFA